VARRGAHSRKQLKIQFIAGLDLELPISGISGLSGGPD